MTFARHKYIMNYARQKKGGKMSPRTGRPTNNPRPNKLSIRISDEDKKILEKYCEENNVNRTEAVSRGIKKLEEK